MIITDEQLRVWTNCVEGNETGNVYSCLAEAAQAALNARQESEGRLQRIKELEMSVARLNGELTVMRQERDAWRSLAQGNGKEAESRLTRIKSLEAALDALDARHGDIKGLEARVVALHGAIARLKAATEERNLWRDRSDDHLRLLGKPCPDCERVRQLLNPDAGLRGEAIEAIRKGLDLLEKLR